MSMPFAALTGANSVRLFAHVFARPISLLGPVVAIFVGAVLTAGLRHHLSTRRAAASPTEAYSTEFRPSVYAEEVAILFGSPTCGFSKIDGLIPATAALIDSLRVAAHAHGDSFSTVGVSLDGSVADGKAWLAPFGTFDELVFGRNWLNSVVVEYIWSDPDAKPAIPQLILLRHHVERGQRTIRLSRDTIVRRWVGVGDLAPAVAARLRGQ